MTKWKYGDSWEKYPIEHREVWTDKRTGSKVSVRDITKELPDYMCDADMIYCDPPWNLGNVNGFYTKADTGYYIDQFSDFYMSLFQRIKLIDPYVCYLEIGNQNKGVFTEELKKLFTVVQEWQITYYKKNPCWLLRGGQEELSFSYSGLDEQGTPLIAIQTERPCVVADLCTGQGLTAIAAYKEHKRFLGTEINKRRMAVAIDKVNKIGGRYEGPVS